MPSPSYFELRLGDALADRFVLVLGPRAFAPAREPVGEPRLGFLKRAGRLSAEPVDLVEEHFPVARSISVSRSSTFSSSAHLLTRRETGESGPLAPDERGPDRIVARILSRLRSLGLFRGRDGDLRAQARCLTATTPSRART